MDGLLVLVNGLPGAGKTTLGGALARELDAWFLSKDAVKEALHGCLENASGIPELGGVAMDTVWAMTERSPVDVVLDSWWFRPRDLEFARTGIARTGARRVVEVWCDIPADIARSRYAARHRADIYRDRHHLAENWTDWAARATPLGLTPTIRVDTTRPIDHIALATQVRTITTP